MTTKAVKFSAMYVSWSYQICCKFQTWKRFRVIRFKTYFNRLK